MLTVMSHYAIPPHTHWDGCYETKTLKITSVDEDEEK
jgi:hypothetical protein